METRVRVAPVMRALLIAVIALTVAVGARADEPSGVGLVVVYAPDDVHTTCVTLDAAEVSGLELLRLAGLDVIQAGTTGVGDTVCKIDAIGCDFPGEHCFCQCLSTPCTFWSYWYWQDGDWAFSQRGAGSRRVSDGAVEAWVWGDGQTAPPAIDVTAICAPSPPQLSAPARQGGYPGPGRSYPGPDDGEGSEPTPEAVPTEDEVPIPTIAPRPEAETPTPEESVEPTITPSATPAGATPGATPTFSATPTATRTPTAARTATATPRMTAEPTGTPTDTLGPTATPTDDGMAAAIATAVARSRATPPAVAGGTGAGGYMAFALLALVLGALVVYAVLLRRQHARRQLE